MPAIANNVTGIQRDVTKLTDLDRVYAAVKAKGRIDVVFANAGVAEFGPLGKITEEFRQTLRHQRKGDTVHRAESLAAAKGTSVPLSKTYVLRDFSQSRAKKEV